jgi:hypothetical protein
LAKSFVENRDEVVSVHPKRPDLCSHVASGFPRDHIVQGIRPENIPLLQMEFFISQKHFAQPVAGNLRETHSRGPVHQLTFVLAVVKLQISILFAFDGLLAAEPINRVAADQA